jgi:hypothetical protein
VLSDGSVLPGARVPGRQGSKCVNDLSVAPTDWKLKMDDNDGPHTEEGNKRVVIHSSRSIFEFGAWGGGANAGQRTFADQTRVLAHELCGHAALMEAGTHRDDSEVDVDGGRPGHDPTIKIENDIAAEIGGPGTAVRGSFSDPHHGESFARVTVNGYPTGQTGVFSLPPEMRERLTTVAKFMRKTRTTKADVMGHADRTGNAAINEQVSRERARNVQGFLIGQGIGPSRFLVNVGKSFDECPPVPGGNPDCRRVEVFVFGHIAASEGHA